MYQRPAAPRSIGGVLDDSIRLFRQSFRYWWLPGLMLAVITALMQVVMFVAFGARPTPQRLVQISSNPGTLLAYVALSLAGVYLFTAMTASINAVAAGRDPTASEGFARAWRALPRTILGGIMMVLAVCGGFVFLVIPGIWVAVRLQVWVVAVVDGDLTARQALAASWRLVAGNWWHTFAVISILMVVLFVLQWVVIMLVTFGFIIAGARGQADLAVLTIATQLAASVTRFITAGLMPATLVAIYRDLRLRRDGDDLEARVSGLAAA